MAGFPPGLVAFQESDAMGANAWISQSSIFEQESANLKWHVIVVVPMERSERDAVRAGTQMFDTILATSILGWFFCMALCYLFFRYRHNRKIQNADYRFTCAFLFGNGLVNLSSLANLGENMKVGLNWAHVVQYELILKQEGALWLRIIFKALLTPNIF